MGWSQSARFIVWIAVLAGAWLAPEVAGKRLRVFERKAAAFASRTLLCALSLCLFVLVTRIVLLPLWEIPRPYIYDEFGYLLQADTFASGRLTNPEHPLSEFFEAPYILQRPTYNAKFPPGQAMVMALGQAILGHPWFGVLLSCGVLAGVLLWALRGWFPPYWALFGSLMTLPLCISSYWMDSYWGGAVTGIGSALLVGAYPRLSKVRMAVRMAPWILGLGAAMLLATRPFEGGLVLIPVFGSLLFKHLHLRDWAAIGVTVLLGAAFLGYYNYQVTGSFTRMPYVEYDRQYPSTPHLNILPLPTPESFPVQNLRWMDEWEREAWNQARSSRFLSSRVQDVSQMLGTFLGSVILILPLLLFSRQVFGARRYRVLLWMVLISLVPVLAGVKYYEHYASPMLLPFVILSVAGFRYVRTVRMQGKPVGLFLSPAMLAAMLLLTAGSEAVRIARHRPIRYPLPNNAFRQELEESIAQAGVTGNVVFVRYTRARTPHQEWIYNRSDIDNQAVIWVQDLGPEKNLRLREYFKGRSFWLMKPDEDPNKVEPYE
jgi:hypothetical protein